MKSIARFAWIAVAIMSMSACTMVPPGNVGVLVDLYGSSKGVSTHELEPGRYWVGYNHQLYIFPTFTQTYTWTRNVNEGRGVDESITFQSVEGLSVNADVGITYHVNPDKVSVLFQKYRQGVDEITAVYLHNMVRDAFVDNASRLPVETIYGTGKETLVEAVQREVSAQVQPFGIEIEKVYLVGNLRLPPTVQAAINAKIAATQMAEQRKNEVAQAQAEAQKAVAVAQGQAQAKLALAQAEAQAIRVKGDALRDNPNLIQLEAVEKWNGELPTYSGGAMPFVQLK